MRTLDACEVPWEAARTRLLLDPALRRAGRSSEADEARGSANAVLERLGVVDDGILDRALVASSGE